MSIDVYPPRNYTQYEEGSFTVTATGFSGTAPSGIARYVRVGKQVTIHIPTLAGTSNAGTFTLTGIPPTLYASAVTSYYCVIQDNSVFEGGLVTPQIGAAAWSVGRLPPSFPPFTASGQKLLSEVTFTYALV